MNEITISNNPDRERYEVLDAGKVIGKAWYKAYDDGGPAERIFYHTVINEDYAGQGLAGRLAKVALDETVAAGLGIVPVCPFIKSYINRHPEYDGSAVPITPAHLQFLDKALAARA
ncbi:GNAT family N-acetyltransferase [Pseudarthrobacter sulfonivorans]|uniref:GNAT family N-acetyltransferase n=1 Tax=Pseudarthrobacter sulfonivorans TaxID=121292 RepID=UPI00210562CC|nr:GNAT family N-acetyltransferase [Pseudarthrobacter sulfonivorans]